MSNDDFNTYAVGDTPLEADSTLLDRARAAKNGEKFGADHDRGEFPCAAHCQCRIRSLYDAHILV